MNKYQELNPSTLETTISKVVTLTLGSVTSYESALSLVSTPKDPITDITNQMIALKVAFETPKNCPKPVIFNLYRLLYGIKSEEMRYRDVEYVPDFGGRVPTSKHLAQGAIKEIEFLLNSFMHDISNAAVDIKAKFLAYIFSSIIRIHPFPDGNGRTARLIVQYVLGSWRMDCLPIPKVRNDLEWKQALELAVDGNLTQLTHEFYTRLQY